LSPYQQVNNRDLSAEDVVGRGIVGFEGSSSGRLLVAHFFKGGDDGNGFLSVEEEAARFCFGRTRGRDTLEGFEDVDGTVGIGAGWVAGDVVTEEK
jgi:hypothetical protein